MADQDGVAFKRAKPLVVVHIAARVRQMAGVRDRLSHGLRLALRHGDDIAERIDLLIVRAAHRTGVRAAEQEELPVKRLLAQLMRTVR